MNDIWALPTGEWVVYTDEDDLIKDFLTLTDLRVVTSYHGLLRKYRAMQFKFPNREDLLEYICRRSRFNYSQVKRLYRRPGNGYNYYYPEAVHQPTLFADEGPRRKRNRKGK